jgi:hypothetical protein
VELGGEADGVGGDRREHDEVLVRDDARERIVNRRMGGEAEAPGELGPEACDGRRQREDADVGDPAELAGGQVEVWHARARGRRGEAVLRGGVGEREAGGGARDDRMGAGHPGRDAAWDDEVAAGGAERPAVLVERERHGGQWVAGPAERGDRRERSAARAGRVGVGV